MRITVYILFFINLLISLSTKSIESKSSIDYNDDVVSIGVSNNLTVPITNTQDSIGDASYCSNNSNSLCNVRSAFMFCNLYSNSLTNTSCQIGILNYNHQYSKHINCYH